jgi:hypothetical protein
MEKQMTRGESIQAAANIPDLTFEENIGVSDELPSMVASKIADAEDRAAALDCWASMMHAAVDAVAECYKSKGSE